MASTHIGFDGLVAPALMLVRAKGFRLPLMDWFGIVLIYSIIGFAAMLVLGTTLLLCYRKLRWTGFVPFMISGGLCAGITSYALRRNVPGPSEIPSYALWGVVSGIVFRAVLFGFRRSATWSN